MRLLLRLLGLLLVLAVLLVGLAFVLPDRAHVQRSITIARPQSQIHLLLTNPRRFNDWSPWFALDPAADYVYSGPDSGVGATLAWSSSNADVGAGSQTIVAVKPDESVSLTVDFRNRGTADMRFDLERRSDETHVTWSLDSRFPLRLDEHFAGDAVGRYVGVFLDSLVGGDLERGLLNLQQLADTFPPIDIAGIEPQLVELPPRRVITIALATEADDAANLRHWNAARQELEQFVAQNRLSVEGRLLQLAPPSSAGDADAELALLAHFDVMPDDTDVRGRVLAATRAVQLEHSGSVAERRKLVDKLRTWLLVKGLHSGDWLVEEYVDGDLLQGTTRISIAVQSPAAN
ncbi:SRPBCC family protein [Tahibacter caeni]|uniref:SRPBCC family protein n=1 Tax=Tahibacter caeni TaxID=1453545 RepID=UPI0021473EE1|nr:SRPBCC family protein [Tahibacter caeni]